MLGPRPFARECFSLIPASVKQAGIRLLRTTEEDASMLGRRLADIDPWARLGFDAARLQNLFTGNDDNAHRFTIVYGQVRAGLIIVRFPWLSGPYLNVLCDQFLSPAWIQAGSNSP